MERKIGEIFEYNGDWYQCVESPDCTLCAFNETDCNDIGIEDCCANRRKDNKDVIYKKLEKVGEPFVIEKVLYQHYKVFDIDNVCGDGFWCVHNYKAKTLTIEIKQKEEDVEEKANKVSKNMELNDLVNEYVNELIDYNEFEKGIKEWCAEPSNSESIGKNLKPFSIEAAKAGKPVCTRDGRKARIICFDVKGDICPIIALVEENGMEVTKSYDMNGRANYKDADNYDLMMLSEKKERWINIYRGTTRPFPGGCLYDTEEEAKDAVKGDENYVTTIQIEWEE